MIDDPDVWLVHSKSVSDESTVEALIDDDLRAQLDAAAAQFEATGSVATMTRISPSGAVSVEIVDPFLPAADRPLSEG